MQFELAQEMNKTIEKSYESSLKIKEIKLIIWGKMT